MTRTHRFGFLFVGALVALGACASSTTGDGAPVDRCTLIPPPADCAADAGGKGSDADGPPASCEGAPAEAIAAASGATGAAPTCPTCVGAEAPVWSLYDFQPLSCGYKQAYGLAAFEGRVTVVATLAGW